MEETRTAAALIGLVLSIIAFICSRQAILRTIEIDIQGLRNEYSAIKLEMSEKLDVIATRAAFMLLRAERLSKMNISSEARSLLTEIVPDLEDDKKIKSKLAALEIPEEWIPRIWSVKPSHEARLKLIEFVRSARDAQLALSEKGRLAQLDGYKESLDYVEKSVVQHYSQADRCKLRLQFPPRCALRRPLTSTLGPT